MPTYRKLWKKLSDCFKIKNEWKNIRIRTMDKIAKEGIIVQGTPGQLEQIKYTKQGDLDMYNNESLNKRIEYTHTHTHTHTQNKTKQNKNLDLLVHLFFL